MTPAIYRTNNVPGMTQCICHCARGAAPLSASRDLESDIPLSDIDSTGDAGGDGDSHSLNLDPLGRGGRGDAHLMLAVVSSAWEISIYGPLERLLEGPDPGESDLRGD
jgi:hypothetical protein